MVYLQRCLVVTWLVPRDNGDIGVGCLGPVLSVIGIGCVGQVLSVIGIGYMGQVGCPSGRVFTLVP